MTVKKKQRKHMTTSRKIKRNREKTVLKKRIKELLGMLEISRNQWNKLNVRVEGKGLDAKIARTSFNMREKQPWGRHIKGHKPNLKELYSVLWDLYRAGLEDKEFLEKLKEELDKKKEMENLND